MREAEPVRRSGRRAPKPFRALRRNVSGLLATLDRTLKHVHAPQFRAGSIHRHQAPGMLAATLNIQCVATPTTGAVYFSRYVCFSEQITHSPKAALEHHEGFGYALGLALINYLLGQWQVPFTEDGWFDLKSLSREQRAQLLGFYKAVLNARH